MTPPGGGPKYQQNSPKAGHSRVLCLFLCLPEIVRDLKSSRAFPFVSWMKGGPVLLLAVLPVSRSQCPSDPDGVEQFMRDRTSGVEHPGVFFCQKPRPEMFQGVSGRLLQRHSLCWYVRARIRKTTLRASKGNLFGVKPASSQHLCSK